MSLKPTVGRIVHFNTDGGPLPAIVTDQNEKFASIHLVVFGFLGEPSVIVRDVMEDGDEYEPGTWSWPPRVP